MPVSASRCPGSGLAAGVLCLVRPSGNSTVFCSRAYGLLSADGASARDKPTASAATTATNRQADRAVSRALTSAVNTATAGQAVAFMAHATPSATAARNTPDGRAMSARVRNIRARIGGSVIPTASGNAITGEAATKMVDSRTLRLHALQCGCGAATRNAAQMRMRDTAVSHSRGSPSRPLAPSARGRPKMAITGSYGLYDCQLVSCPCGRYGEPCCSSSTAACDITLTSAVGCTRVTSQVTGTASAPASDTSSGTIIGMALC